LFFHRLDRANAGPARGVGPDTSVAVIPRLLTAARVRGTILLAMQTGE
jgi:hypothetical protein